MKVKIIAVQQGEFNLSDFELVEYETDEFDKNVQDATMRLFTRLQIPDGAADILFFYHPQD